MKRAMVWVMTAAALCGTAILQAQSTAAASQSSAAATQSSATPSSAGDLTGNWQGTLAIGNGQRVLIKAGKDGAQYKASLYLIDGGGRMFGVTGFALHGPDVTFTIGQMNAKFAGTLNPDGKSITGNLTLVDGSLHPLSLAHVSDDAAWAVPEPPRAMPADAKPKFEVVTVKPSDPNQPGKLFTVRGRHIMTINTTVGDLITFAYGLHPKQIINGPPWMNDKYDLDGVPDVEGQPSAQQMRLLVQDALATRFALRFHHDRRELAVYALTVAKDGPKLTVTADPPSAPRNFLFGRMGQLRVSNSTMRDFCDGMQGAVMDKPVVDQTGLTDRYDFTLNWTPDEGQFAALGGYRPPAQEDPNAPPSLYTALQEQLGLKLESTRAMVDAFVIDHIERPGAN